MVPNAPTMRAGTASLSVIASGSGGTVVAGTSPGAIAYTGADMSGSLAAALGALLTGLALALLARFRRSA
jgi:LPXTG-motif cell wall-anchored protein